MVATLAHRLSPKPSSSLPTTKHSIGLSTGASAKTTMPASMQKLNTRLV